MKPPCWCHWMHLTIRNKNIWFRCGDLKGFWNIMPFMKWRGWGMPPCNPLKPSCKLIYHITSKDEVARQVSRCRSPEKGRDAECTSSSETGTIKMDRPGYQNAWWTSMESYKLENAPMVVRRSDTKTPSKPPLRTRNITTELWEQIAQDWAKCWGLIRRGAGEYKAKRISKTEQKHIQQKAGTKASPTELSSQTCLLSATGSLELRLVSSAILEHTNSSTLCIRTGHCQYWQTNYYPQISEWSVQWLLRNCPDKIWVDFCMLQGTLWVHHFEFWKALANSYQYLSYSEFQNNLSNGYWELIWTKEKEVEEEE